MKDIDTLHFDETFIDNAIDYNIKRVLVFTTNI